MTAREDSILIIGSANTDMVIKTHRFPAAGETILGGDFFMFSGGKGANQSVAARRLGGNVTFVCKVGNDIFGGNAIAGYKKEGIETKHIITDQEHPSGVAVITVNAEGENNIVVASGANDHLLPGDIDPLLHVIREASVVVLQLEIPIDTVMHVARQAKEQRKRVILNPAPAASLPDELYKELFLITPNETETELLTGLKVTDENSARDAAAIFVRKGVQHVIITMGAKGAFLKTQEYTGMVPAPTVTPVDTTAAGDIFNGALAVALVNRMPWREAASFACRAAAYSVTKMGAQSSAPFEGQLADFYS